MTSHTATAFHLYRTIADVVTSLKSAPNWISMPEPAVGTMPIVMVDLRSHDDARAWAGHIGLTDPGSVLVNPRMGETSLSFLGEWLGWRVLVTGRQASTVPTVDQVAAAALTPDAVVAP